jgi:hypothetical protein
VVCPCTTRSTWYRANNGASFERTPPSELCPLQVENAHSWKNATMKSTPGPLRQARSWSSSQRACAPWL